MQILNMPFLLSFFATFMLFSIIFVYKRLVSLSSNNNEFKKKLQILPPCPPKLPFIGNLHQLGNLPHRSLRSISRKYGDFMLFYFGNRPTFVVSSATAAERIVKTHEHLFPNRPYFRLIERLFYNGNDVGFSVYDEKWRYRRSLCVTQLLSNKRVRSFRPIREQEVARMVEEIKTKGYGGSSTVNLSEVFAEFFTGLMCRTALGRKQDGGRHGRSGKDIYTMFKELSEVMVEVSVGDFVPCLSWVDKLSGLENRVENVRKQFDEFIEQVIQEREILLLSENHQGLLVGDDDTDNVKDFAQVLFEIHRENPEKLSRDNVKGIILDILGAGTDSSSTTLGWAMTELVRHPKIMKKLQEEIRTNVKPNTKVSELDLDNMKYLKAVIKETLRLHPSVPLSIFREISRNVKIDKYDLDAKTQIVINTWAIQRDTRYWQDPEEFYPERFLSSSSSIDFKGQHFQFIPFGAGRRGCPGVSLAIVTIELALANLVYEFNWTLPNGEQGETLDVVEKWGASVRRLNPLIVVATQSILDSCNNH